MEATIRTTGTILLILVLATAAVVGGYSLLLAARRGPIPTAPPAPLVELPPEIPDPGRLPRRQEVVPASVRPDRDEVVLVAVEVLVTGARRPDPGDADPERADPGERALGGVAVLDGRNGAPLAWQPLSDAQETPEGLRLLLEGVPEGDHVVALAAAPDRARYGYRARVPLSVAAGGDHPPKVLDGRTQDVTVHIALQGRPQDALLPVFELSRVDDPLWHPPISAEGIHEDPMTVPTRGGVLRLRALGPGRYALRPLDGAYEAFEFEVPGPEAVTATYRL